MRKIFFTIALAVASFVASAAVKPTVVEPAHKQPTSFAIVIDSET
jgi:hypothetical protein